MAELLSPQAIENDRLAYLAPLAIEACRQLRIMVPSPAAIERLCQMPEFVRAYEPDGMSPSEFVGFGATQRTLCQFVEVGWKLMENYR